MPTLAGWITGEQVPAKVIEQVLSAMGEVLGRYGGQPARTQYPGAGLIAFSDAAYAMQRNDEPPVLDWVPDRRTLVYRRPLSGWHPLYYIVDWPAEGNLLFASEIKALFAVGVPRHLHLPALDALWRYGFIPAPWTIFRDIQIVPAGSILRWQRAKTVLNHATDYHFDQPLEPLPSQDDLLAQLTDICTSQLPLHEHLIALANGDMASALPPLLISQETNQQFPIITLGYKKTLGAKVWQRGQQVAQACSAPFLGVTAVDQPAFWTAALSALEAPCLDTRPLALHQLLHTASEETSARVAFSGLGANIVFSGYDQTEHVTKSDDILFSYRQTIRQEQNRSIEHLWSAEAAQMLREEKPWETTLHAQKLARRADQFADFQQGRYYLDLHLRLPDYAIYPASQLATQEHIALRSPYLHPRLLDTLARLPATLSDGTAKASIITALIQRLRAPINGHGTIAPLSVPVISLLQIENSDFLQQVLSPTAIRERGIFQPDIYETLRRQAKKHTVSQELLLVFTTQLLCQLFDVRL